ncbi:MAG: hypothetical protein AB7K24_13715 [Gemmataceae bacterium]
MTTQAVTGVTPPQLGEALIREKFPSIQAIPAVASLGRMLILSYVGAPLGWALMLPFYFKKVLPVIGQRYRLTNRRVMICRGMTAVPTQEISLGEIDDVRVVTDDNSKFFRAANLELVSNGKVALTLAGVGDPEPFRHAIINACRAWAPGRMKAPFVAAK